MIRPILMYPDPRLRQLAAPVLSVDAEVRQVIADMFDTLYDAKGRGLAAVQIGVLQRIFVMDATWKSGDGMPMSFINPEILWSASKLQTGEEGCLSIPDEPVQVARPERVEMMWLDSDGTQQRGAFEGFEAACICHEIDHLNGVLILDHKEAA